LDPWPTTIRSVKFGNPAPNQPNDRADEFELKDRIAQLFELVRSNMAGEIRVLEVRGGLPFAMEIVSDTMLSGLAVDKSAAERLS
jgi:hypothetical protein